MARSNNTLVSILLLLSVTSVGAFSPVTRSTQTFHRTQEALSRTSPSCNTQQSSTSLNSAVSPTVGAIAGAISGGLFAGGLHAIAGPDHLAALLPRCCGQRWYRAGRVGALWGMGHGVSATLLGMSAFALKSTVNQMKSVKTILTGASHVTEIAVGLSLIIIGVMGIKEAGEWESQEVQSLSAAAVEPTADSTKRAVIFNGLLHGFSWDGAPSLAPAVAVATWGGSLAFLSAYAVGTMAAMAFVTTLVGEGTRQAGQIFQRPDIPQKLSIFSSVLAMGIGAFWCYLAIV